MILKRIREMNKKWQMLALSISLFAFVAGAALPAPSASAAATYSCGTYSSGAYSSNSTCGTSTGGGGTSTGGSGVGAPNTGFAKLMEPTNLLAVIASLALLVTGIVVILKSRSSKKQDVSFTSRD
jgi:uncharacterized membrane protein